MAGFYLDELKLENVMNLRLVQIVLNGQSKTITGDNGAGKSAVFKGIRFALGANGKPIREGADHIAVELTFRDKSKHVLEIKRKATATGTPMFGVKLDGDTKTSPAAFLKQFKSELMTDPLGFDRLCDTAEGNRKQAEILRGIAGLDFTAMDAERTRIFTARTRTNTLLDSTRANLAEMAEAPNDTPDEEVKVTEIVEKLKAFEAQERAVSAHQESLRRVNDKVALKCVYQEEANEAIKEAERAMARALRAGEAAKAEVVKAQEEITRHPEAPATPDKQVRVDLEKQISQADQVNAAVRLKRQRASASSEVQKLDAESKTATTAIQACDKKKADAIRNAKYPVPGLSVDEVGVLFDGRRYQDWNRAQRLKIATAITCAQNPGLNLVLVDDADGIGPEVEAAILETAAKHEKHVLFGRYQREAGPTGIHIELGEVVVVDGRPIQKQ